MSSVELWEKDLNQIASDIILGLDGFMQREAEGWGPVDHSPWNWASEAHHPCDRFLVYARTHWPQRKAKDPSSMYRLDEGKRQENKIHEYLAKAGYKLELGQMPLVWDKFQLKGKIDGAAIRGKFKFPAEIKSTSPHYWDSTRTLEDIKKHTKFWIQRIPSQLNLYLFMMGLPGGLLILVTWGQRPRVLPMALDYELGEKDLQQLERINAHVKGLTLPDRIIFDNSVCGFCDFDHVCQPVKFAELSTVSVDQLKDLLRYLDLKPDKKEYDQLHKKLIGDKSKPGVFWNKNAIVEDIEITSKEFDQTYYEIPEKLKTKYKKTRTIVRTSIERIG